jgi:hypothetical protein
MSFGEGRHCKAPISDGRRALDSSLAGELQKYRLTRWQYSEYSSP